MDDRYIFHWKELPFDGAYYLAEELYSARRQKKLSLEEVSRATGIPPVRIDAQEVMSADIDFHIIARLLDFYRIKLGLSKGFFPGLPQNYQKKIFPQLRQALRTLPFLPGRNRTVSRPGRKILLSIL